jgi:tRNA pseudouridine55 synthase
MTSHDVVSLARRALDTSRVGHGGTLDPDATGVLLLGVGSVTRLLRFVTALPKTYVAEIVLGVETTTLDAAGEVTATHDMSGVDDAHVVAAAAALTGDILQVPPMVSAVRVGGRRLHELAREGKEVERAPRPVTVHRFEVSPVATGRWRAEVECSSGTYVRTLAADLGAALGGGAHLGLLRRVAVGPFTVDEAVALDRLGVEDLRPPADAVGWLPAVEVDGEVADAVAHGQVLPLGVIGPGGGPPPANWRVMDRAGELLAVYEPHTGERAKPSVVLATQ